MVLVDVMIPGNDGVSVTLAAPLEVPPTTTIAELQAMIRDLGFPVEVQSLGVIPRQLLAWDDVIDARGSGAHVVDERRKLDHYVATDDSEVAEPLHGYLPLSKRAETLEVRQRMRALEEELSAAGDALDAIAVQQQLTQLVEEEKQAIDREIERAADMEVYETLRKVVYDLRNEYQSIYMSNLRLVRHAERDALERLGLITAKVALEQGSDNGNSFFKQSSSEIVPLIRTAHRVKRELFDPYFAKYAERRRDEVQFFPTGVKGVWRAVEKVMAKKNSASSFESVCDFVRGAIASASLSELVNVIDHLDNDPQINILRIKNGFRKPDDTSWADCIVNFVFLGDPEEHICELQLVHVKLMRARRKMGARTTFVWYRSAVEMLRRDSRWTDEQTILEVYNKTDGESWKESQSWCSGRPVSRWSRVRMHPNGRISELLLSKNNLHGGSYCCTLECET